MYIRPNKKSAARLEHSRVRTLTSHVTCDSSVLAWSLPSQAVSGAPSTVPEQWRSTAYCLCMTGRAVLCRFRHICSFWNLSPLVCMCSALRTTSTSSCGRPRSRLPGWTMAAASTTGWRCSDSVFSSGSWHTTPCGGPSLITNTDTIKLATQLEASGFMHAASYFVSGELRAGYFNRKTIQLQEVP